MPPRDPLAAATHADPYPYYAALRAGPPLAWDASLGLWIASRAGAVEAVLAHPGCRVRPLAEPVPRAIADGAAGAVYGRLARMNEGDAHSAPRRALADGLAALSPAALDDAIAQAAPLAGASAQWHYAYPVQVLAALLGVAGDARAAVACDTAAFVACLSPLSDAAALARSHEAAQRLRTRMAGLLETACPDGLLGAVRAAAARTGWTDSAALHANVIGLFSQTYEAGAGLIGNALLALRARPHLLARIAAEPDLVHAVIAETARFDPPVQNTRRFCAGAQDVAGVALPDGAAILVLLAAAGRDPAANAQPDAFLPERPARRLFGFGHGRHACPGQALALTIAAAGLAALARSDRRPGAARWSYQASVNGRIPLFHEEEN